MGMGYSVTAPAGVILASLPASASVIHRFPSGPVMTVSGLAWGWADRTR